MGSSIARIPLGAPGLYPFPETRLQALTGVRLDVCGFAGVAPRGPVREPVVNEDFPADVPAVEPGRPRMRTMARPVESFDEYKRLYGQFEGPGLLPYAVASFFEQGGRRAYIARIVHDYSLDSPPQPAMNLAGIASGAAPGATAPGGPIVLHSRNEGAWGNGLTAQFQFTASTLLFDTATVTGFRVASGTALTAGALLRLTFAPGTPAQFATVASVMPQPLEQQAGHELVVTLNQAAPAAPVAVDQIATVLLVDDGDGRGERHEGVGMSPLHPRWLATVLSYESSLLFPDASWADDEITPDDVTLTTAPPASPPFSGGLDRYADIIPDDFFDPLWLPGDPDPGNGIQAFGLTEDLGSLALPDLYSPGPLALPETFPQPVSLAGPEFRRCVDLPPATSKPLRVAAQDLAGLRLDPNTDLAAIIGLHKRVMEFVDGVRNVVALLDVPPGLNRTRILQWRNAIDSSYAAAYHPWLVVVRSDDLRGEPIRIPPSSTAAGIIARVEIASGIPTGPANVLAAQVVDVDDVTPAALHDELHPLGINVYLRDRDGIRLTGARTLSRDRSLRQLSVRRLMLLLRRTLAEQTQWMVFEPNNGLLRNEVRQLVTSFLRDLAAVGAFRGATEAESFFVRCDDTNNPPRLSDLGQLIVEVGVAPSEPLEYIVLRIVREGDGTLNIQEAKG
jgi:uncharacterized protein